MRAATGFTELGPTLEGRMPIEGEWAGRVTGVRGQRVMFTVEDLDDTLAVGLCSAGLAPCAYPSAQRDRAVLALRAHNQKGEP